jgi:uncharacterized lipoprotein YajG
MTRVVLAALVATLALAACGSNSRSTDVKPVGEMLVGSVAPMAQCSDWNAGTRDQRLATIHDIRQQVNLRDGTVQTPQLSDHEAYRIFRQTCRRKFAAGFRLYKLYARAASFAEFADG